MWYIINYESSLILFQNFQKVWETKIINQLIEHFAAEVFDFFINNSPTTVIPSEELWYKIIQSIGATGTFGAFIFIGLQTRTLRRQTEALRTQTNILQHEYDITFRPWIQLEWKSDSEPIEINIEPETNTVTATLTP